MRSRAVRSSAVGHSQSQSASGLKRPSRARESRLSTLRALFVFELGGDDVLEQDGGAPTLAGGFGDAVVQLVGGAVEAEAAEVSRQRREGFSVRGHRRPPGHAAGRRGLAVRVGRAA